MNFETASRSYRQNLTAPRRRGALSANSRRLYSSYACKLERHFGDLDLAVVKNGRVKTYIESLRAQALSPSTIVGIFGVLKSIIASVKNEDGDRIYQQNLDADFLALPILKREPQTCATAADVEKAIATGFPIVAFLAASGVRISEALALCVNGDADCYDPATGVINIRETLKTRSARRSVILPEIFRAWFSKHVPSSGRLFPKITYQRLHDALIAAGLPQAHAYRRFRVSHLRQMRCQEDILRGQVGHSKASIYRSLFVPR
jgi:integrase